MSSSLTCPQRAEALPSKLAGLFRPALALMCLCISGASCFLSLCKKVPLKKLEGSISGIFECCATALSFGPAALSLPGLRPQRLMRHGSPAGVLGDVVAINKDKAKITVTTETAFSKRHETLSMPTLVAALRLSGCRLFWEHAVRIRQRRSST